MWVNRRHTDVLQEVAHTVICQDPGAGGQLGLSQRAENREPTSRAGKTMAPLKLRARHVLGLRSPSHQDWLMPTRRGGALPHSAPCLQANLSGRRPHRHGALPGHP